jgi:UDP-GlcNAc3NAcA epimerase
LRKLVTIVGARPQFVKAAVVSRALHEVSGADQWLVHTGQHFDDNMSEVFFQELSLPAADLNLGISGGSHGAQTGRMLEALESVMIQQAPDWVLVYGDTNSTLAGALAAAKLNIPVAHVEAGLRSGDRTMPEEVNRIVTDHIATCHFAPTQIAVAHLAREGIPTDSVHLVGDVMYDAALYYGARADEQSTILTDLAVDPGKYILATVHRPSNTDDPDCLRAIFLALEEISAELPVIVPVHPRTRQALSQAGITMDHAAFHLIEPTGYLDMLMLEKNAGLIATDSGGVQKEAFFWRVPCVTLRTTTEWVELVELGWNRLLPPTSADTVVTGIREALSRPAGDPDAAPYGTGDAAQKIAHILCGTNG